MAAIDDSQFNPFKQNVTFHHADGSPFEVWLPRVDLYMQYCIRICINYGSQLGASIILLLVLVLLTRAERRSSAVFLLNCFALLFNVIRLVCQIVYFTTDFTELYRYFAHDYESGIAAGAYAASILGVVLIWFLLVCVLASLILQVQVVCSTFRIIYRRLLLGASVAIALVPLGFRFGYVVQASHRIIDAEHSYSVQWLESATNIAFTINICLFCVVFVAKLGYAIRQRKRLGVRDFGPMKVIFIMGCQTMFIPALFAVLQYIIVVPELASNVLTLVTIFLPLSSIWAGTALDHARSNQESGHRLWNLLSFGESQKSRRTSTGSTAGNAGNACGSTQSSKWQTEQDEYGICVAREYSVHSYQKAIPSEHLPSAV